MAKKILIVDDECKIREIIALFLRAENYIVYEAENGEEALRLAKEYRPDLLILDVMLPDVSGFDVCQSIREFLRSPIIFLTALGDDEHHILGYRVGADDYLVKPFKPSILALKVNRVLERLESRSGDIYEGGQIVLDVRSHSCKVEGQQVMLTNKEFDLLMEFMKNRGMVLSRMHLLKVIWGYDYIGETRVVDAMVKNLRKKLGEQGTLIKTVISVGYQFDA